MAIYWIYVAILCDNWIIIDKESRSCVICYFTFDCYDCIYNWGFWSWWMGIWNIGSCVMVIIVGLSINYGLHVVYCYVTGCKYGYNARESRIKSIVDKVLVSICTSSLILIVSCIILYFSKIVMFSNSAWMIAVAMSWCISIFVGICCTPK